VSRPVHGPWSETLPSTIVDYQRQGGLETRPYDGVDFQKESR